MRIIVLLVAAGVLMTCLALPAHAAAKISLYADETRESCELVDVFPEVVQIHIFYEGDSEANAIFFYAPTPECWDGAIWLGDVIFDPWVAGLGDSHDASKGAAVLLHGCETGVVHLGYMSFQAQGRGSKCCTYELEASDTSGEPAIIDCSSNLIAVETGDLVVNPHGKCRCEDGNIIVAAEASTWGQVKALYQ